MAAEHEELRSIAYLDLDGRSGHRGERAVNDEPLELRGGHDGDLNRQGMPKQHATEAVAPDVSGSGAH